MNPEQLKQDSTEELKKRIANLSKSDMSNEQSIYDLAKAEDKFHESWKKDKLPKNLENEYANRHSSEVLKTMEAEKEKMTDGLTGLRNRKALEEEVSQMLSLVRSARRNVTEPEKRRAKHCSILIMDLDDFKNINDIQGHPAGDKMLKNIADIFKSSIRKKLDVAYRYGGEEFAIFLPDMDIGKARERAEQIRKKVEEKLSVTISVGVSSTSQIPSWQEASRALEIETIKNQLIYQSDKAMYVSKKTGKNKVTVYDTNMEKEEKIS